LAAHWGLETRKDNKKAHVPSYKICSYTQLQVSWTHLCVKYLHTNHWKITLTIRIIAIRNRNCIVYEPQIDINIIQQFEA
jgi:hypothetical protein